MRFQWHKSFCDVEVELQEVLGKELEVEIVNFKRQLLNVL